MMILSECAIFVICRWCTCKSTNTPETGTVYQLHFPNSSFCWDQIHLVPDYAPH